MLATVLFASIAAHARGVYLAEVQVHFQAPASSVNPNVLVISPSSLIIMAGAVEKIIDQQTSPRLVSANSTLASEGIKHGYGISLPNTGGQWANIFSDPWLDIQAVGGSADEVNATASQLVAQVNAAVVKMQQQAGVDQYNLVSTALSPPSGPVVTYYSGSRSRAALGTLVLGVGITAFVVTGLRRYVRRRQAPAPVFV